MDREILFRGKHIHALSQNEHLDGTWVYGYLCDENYINSPELEGEYLVDKDTVGQYIGVRDKNKKEIYEGDIVKNEYGYIGIVKWECCSFVLDWISWNASRDLYVWSSSVEVIGNIFDNPELLEIKQKEGDKQNAD